MINFATKIFSEAERLEQMSYLTGPKGTSRRTDEVSKVKETAVKRFSSVKVLWVHTHSPVKIPSNLATLLQMMKFSALSGNKKQQVMRLLSYPSGCTYMQRNEKETMEQLCSARFNKIEWITEFILSTLKHVVDMVETKLKTEIIIIKQLRSSACNEEHAKGLREGRWDSIPGLEGLQDPNANENKVFRTLGKNQFKPVAKCVYAIACALFADITAALSEFGYDAAITEEKGLERNCSITGYMK